MTPSDTPETDANLYDIAGTGCKMERSDRGSWVDEEFARELERERNAAIREKMQWRTKAWEWERQATQKMALRRELEELLGITEHVPASDEAFEDGMARLRAVIAERDAAIADADRLFSSGMELMLAWDSYLRHPDHKPFLDRLADKSRQFGQSLTVHEELPKK